MCASKLVGIDRLSFAERRQLFKHLSIVDLCVASFYIAPATIAFWSSTWSIVGVIEACAKTLLKDQDVLVAAFIATLGFSISFVFTLLQKQIKGIFTAHLNSGVLYFLGSRLYSYLIANASVLVWYGVWEEVDNLAGSNLMTILAVVIIAYLGLLVTKTSSNLKAAPFSVIIDSKKDFFDSPTCFETLNPQRDTGKKLIVIVPDVILSVLIVGTLVAVVWKGSWVLLTAILNFGDDELSNFLALIIGYFIATVTYFLQPPVERWVKKMKDWRGLLILDIYSLLIFCGSICVWFGCWNAIVMYTQLEQSVIISVLVHLMSFLLLMVGRVTKTAGISGAVQETADNVEDCVELAMYIRSDLKENRETDPASNTVADPENKTDKTELNHSNHNDVNNVQ